MATMATVQSVSKLQHSEAATIRQQSATFHPKGCILPPIYDTFFSSKNRKNIIYTADFVGLAPLSQPFVALLPLLPPKWYALTKRALQFFSFQLTFNNPITPPFNE